MIVPRIVQTSMVYIYAWHLMELCTLVVYTSISVVNWDFPDVYAQALRPGDLRLSGKSLLLPML